jgi:hypothetical protein
MASDNSLLKFKCSLSTENHFAFNSSRINCGHPICSRCICKLNRESKCKICDKYIGIEDIDVSYTGIHKSIDNSMEDIILDLKNCFSATIQNLKS